jgi:AraC-like DNA-binding protein
MAVILVLTTLFSLVMALIALLNRHENPKTHLSFMALMLCFFFLLAELTLIKLKLTSLGLLWFPVSSVATVAIPSCFYLYFSSSLRLESEFKLKDGVHFIFPAIFAILLTPYSFVPLAEKVAVLTALSHKEPLPWFLQITPTREIRMGMVAVLGAFYVQLCWHELHHESNHKKADVLREISRFRWIILVMGAAIGCTLIFFMVRLPYKHNWAISALVMPLVICMGLLYWRLPQWGHKWWIPAKDTEAVNHQASLVYAAELTSDKEEDKKYRSSVTNELAHITMTNLQTMMQAGLYKDSTLTLRKLAHELNLSQHHLSQIINEQTQGNYYDLLNQYRINEAKDLLLHSEMNVINIAYEVGFNSKSSFYTEFKRQNNCTPGQFKKSKGEVIFG